MEKPDKVIGRQQLDRQVEGDWLLVDESAVSHIPRINAKEVKEVDNATLESGGIAFLNEEEDAHEQRNTLARSSFREDGAEALDKIGSFFKKTGGLIAKKYEETDFKAKSIF